MYPLAKPYRTTKTSFSEAHKDENLDGLKAIQGRYTDGMINTKHPSHSNNVRDHKK